MNIQPLLKRVLLEQLENKETTASGIILPDSAQERPKMAKVLAVGEDVKMIKKGDTVLYKSFGPDEVKVGDKEYLISEEKDILAIVKGEK